jgi:lysophospholipase L1-like esterase
VLLGGTRTGEASQWILSWLGEIQPVPGVRGYQSLDDVLRDSDRKGVRRNMASRHQNLLRRPDEYRRRQKQLHRLSRRGVRLLDPLEVQLARRLRRTAAERGVGLIFVISPQLNQRPNLIWAAENGAIDHLLSYNDPIRYQDLYDLEHRWDNGHLNGEGARIFSRYLAADIDSIDEAARAR